MLSEFDDKEDDQLLLQLLRAARNDEMMSLDEFRNEMSKIADDTPFDGSDNNHNSTKE